MRKPLSPFYLMNIVFIGLAASLTYGLVSTALLYAVEPRIAPAFLEAYFTSFRTILSLGLILGTALLVYKTQYLIPDILRDSFTTRQLARSSYPLYEQRYLSRRRSLTFAAEFVIAAFIIFTLCQFPLQSPAEDLMIIAACAEYGFGVYVGRKLCYAGMMLHSLLPIRVRRNLFANRELDEINSYVNIVSTLTILFVYVHVTNYYDAPFLCGSAAGESVRMFLILPAVIATPVLLIFNFYPRVVLRKVYSRSIEVELKRLRSVLSNEELSAFERRSHLVDFERMSQDQVRFNLRLTLNDLPIGIIIMIMILGPLLGK